MLAGVSSFDFEVETVGGMSAHGVHGALGPAAQHAPSCRCAAAFFWPSLWRLVGRAGVLASLPKRLVAACTAVCMVRHISVRCLHFAFATMCVNVGHL